MDCCFLATSCVDAVKTGTYLRVSIDDILRRENKRDSNYFHNKCDAYVVLRTPYISLLGYGVRSTATPTPYYVLPCNTTIVQTVSPPRDTRRVRHGLRIAEANLVPTIHDFSGPQSFFPPRGP